MNAINHSLVYVPALTDEPRILGHFLRGAGKDAQKKTYCFVALEKPCSMLFYFISV